MNFKEELKKEVLKQLEEAIGYEPIDMCEEVIKIKEMALTSLDEVEGKKLLIYFAEMFIITVLETMLLECLEGETI